MPTEKHVTDFVVNKVPTKSIFEKMKNQGLINDDEIYLVERDDSDKTYVSYESQSLTAAQKSQARTNIGAAASSHNHKAGDITSGTLPLDRGGTGSSESLRDAPNGAIIRKLKSDSGNSLWYTATASGALYATSENGVPNFGTLPIAQGGTGATSAADARSKLGAAASSHTHGAGDITGTLGIAHGGTGATTAEGARTNLGAAASSHTHNYLPLSGGTIKGNVTISSDNPWIELLDNDSSAFLQMYSSGTRIALGFGSAKSIIIDSDGCLILTAAMYGTTLPAAGKKGRIFFKKV